ncbi:hypothetical protein CHUAL_010928 [Chamberlinius hualienensis]
MSLAPIIAVGVIAILIASKILKYIQWISIINRIPGPKGLPIIGVSWQLLTRRENVSKTFRGLMLPYAKQYPLVKVWIGPSPILYICKAEAAKVLLNHSKQIVKADFYGYLRNWLGEGLLTSTGAKWQVRRKLITPAFHFRILEKFLVVMNEQTDILIQILSQKCLEENNSDFNIYPYIGRCALDIICETAMGQGIRAQLNTDSEYIIAVDSLTRVFKQRLLRPWLAKDWIFKLSSLSRLENQSLSIVHGFTNKIIKTKRLALSQSVNSTSKAEDEFGQKRRVALLDLLLEESMSKGNQILTDEDIREEVDTFMFAGHDTTSIAISWSIYCIGQHPEIQQKVVDELKSVYDTIDRSSTTQDLANLKYLECVIKECLRLFPPVPGFARKMTEDINICGYKVPSGATVMVAPIFLHRDEDHYKDSNIFDPDRFLQENVLERDSFAYIPFSAGLRNCIGQKYAMMEVKVVLSRILRKFKVTTVAEKDLWSNLAGEIVLRPIRGVRVKLEQRE